MGNTTRYVYVRSIEAHIRQNAKDTTKEDKTKTKKISQHTLYIIFLPFTLLRMRQNKKDAHLALFCLILTSLLDLLPHFDDNHYLYWFIFILFFFPSCLIKRRDKTRHDKASEDEAKQRQDVHFSCLHCKMVRFLSVCLLRKIIHGLLQNEFVSVQGRTSCTGYRGTWGESCPRLFVAKQEGWAICCWNCSHGKWCNNRFYNAGMSLQVTNLGAAILSCQVPDADGKFEEVHCLLRLLLWLYSAVNFLHILCFKVTLNNGTNLERLITHSSDMYLGVSVGRVCNRIAKGQFSLDGKVQPLPHTRWIDSYVFLGIKRITSWP